MKKKHLLYGRLSSYAALAGAFLTTQQADTQIVYTDVDPDIEVNQGDLVGFDLDNDADDDFGLVNVLYSGIGAMNIIVYSTAQGAAGYNASVFGSTFPFASMFDAGEEIGPGLGWYSTASAAPLLWGSFAVVGSFGQWDNVTNKYVGLRTHSGANYNYGWARLDVSHTQIVLKDYAYNETANSPISTTVGINDTENDFFPTIYSFDEGVRIVLPIGIQDARVSIYDLSGREIFSQEVFNHADISLADFASGLYALSITSGDLRYSTMISAK